MVRTDAEVTTARANLKEQALLSYLAGGAPMISQLARPAGPDPSLTVAYAEIVTGGQRRAVDAYRACSAPRRQSKQLTPPTSQAARDPRRSSDDRAAAAQAWRPASRPSPRSRASWPRW